MRERVLLVLSCAISAVHLIAGRGMAFSDDETLPVVCPAIGAEDYEPIWGKEEDPGSIELVVVGKIQSAGKDPTQHDKRWHLTVEKCLYGNPSIKAIPKVAPVRYCAGPRDNSRGVFALSRQGGAQDPEWVIRHTYPIEEEQWQVALASARFDFAVLSSTYVFAGRWRSKRAHPQAISGEPDSILSGDEGAGTLSVIRAIYGSDLPAGALLALQRERGAVQPPLHAGREAIYAVALVGSGTKRRPNSAEEIEEARYRLVAHWPLECEAEIRAALSRRATYPIVEGQRNRISEGREDEWLPWDAFRFMSSGPRCREITLRRSVDDAVAMLASESVGVRLLATRTLVIRRAESRPKLLPIVEDNALAERETRSGQFRGLYERIRVLAEMGEAESGGALRQYVEKILAHVEAHRIAEAAPPPPWRVQTMWDRKPTGADLSTKSPHALLWILECLSQEDAVKHYGRRLVALRAHAPQPWRDAIQEALEAQRIEESLELAAGWQRVRAVPPARSHPGPWCVNDSENIIFSSDGRLMIVTSGFGQAAVWSTADWKVTRFLSYQRRYPDFDLSPAGDALRVVFHDSITTVPLAREQPERVNRLPQIPEMYPSRISADGRFMVGPRGHDNVLDIWDTAAGKLVRSIMVPQYRNEYALAARTGLIAYNTSEGFAVSRLAAFGEEKPLMSGDEVVASLAFSPDERTLLSTLHPTAAEEIQLWNLADGKLLSSAAWQHGPTVAAFSASGKTVGLVSTGGSYEIGVYRLPDLQHLGGRSIAKRESSYHSETAVAISPDDQWLAVTATGQGLWIYALPAMKEVKSCPIADPSYRSHSAPGIAFSPDGKWLVAAGVDRPAPRWLRAADWTEVEPCAGHGGQVAGLQFLDDGKTLLSWGSDGSVCRWEARTMVMQSRIRIPDGYLPLRMHGKGSRLLLCAEAADRSREARPRRRSADRGGELPEAVPRQAQKLFDLEKQRFIGELRVPATGGVIWLNEDEYCWGVEQKLRRVRARDGSVLGQGEIPPERNSFAAGPAQFDASEDGRQLWSLSGLRGDPRGLDQLTLRIFDVGTLKLRKEVALDRRHWSNEPFALVPGGKFFSIGPKLFDRQTCRFLHDRQYPEVHFNQMAFSPDGSRYAAASYGPMYVEGGPPGWNSDDYGFIHVHDTASGRLIAMIPSSSRWGRVTPLCFSDDGRRLAFSGIEGVIAVWNLPP